MEPLIELEHGRSFNKSWDIQSTSSCSSSKSNSSTGSRAGPIRATILFPSCHNFRPLSPSLCSKNWKSNKNVSSTQLMWKTTEHYLSGGWPRLDFRKLKTLETSILSSQKYTQTPDEWKFSQSSGGDSGIDHIDSPRTPSLVDSLEELKLNTVSHRSSSLPRLTHRNRSSNQTLPSKPKTIILFKKFETNMKLSRSDAEQTYHSVDRKKCAKRTQTGLFSGSPTPSFCSPTPTTPDILTFDSLCSDESADIPSIHNSDYHHLLSTTTQRQLISSSIPNVMDDTFLSLTSFRRHSISSSINPHFTMEQNSTLLE